MSVLDFPVMARPARTIGEVAAMNLLAASGDRGIASQLKATKRGASAAVTVACLAIAAINDAAQDGGWPTQADYAEYWRRDLRHTQREWALVREAFPGEDGPDRLARIIALDYRQRLAEDGPTAALSFPLPGGLPTA